MWWGQNIDTAQLVSSMRLLCLCRNCQSAQHAGLLSMLLSNPSRLVALYDVCLPTSLQHSHSLD